MRPQDMIIRCYAERVGDQWEAFCLDLSLGAQGETFDEAKHKLEEQIRELVHDALQGEDRENAPLLFARKAPLSFWTHYWYASARTAFAQRFLGRPSRRRVRFVEALPLVPALC